MKKYRFKTDIHCSSCIAKIDKELQNHPALQKWDLDLKTKILEVEGEIPDIQHFQDTLFEKTQVYVEELKND